MSQPRTFPLSSADRLAIERALAPVLAEHPAGVCLFGSRARGDARHASDIDLALMSERPMPPDALAKMREALEDSNVPFRIDLVDFANAPRALRTAIERDGIPWHA